MIGHAEQLSLHGIAPCRLRVGEKSGDLFAGGGGFSLGFKRANGRSPTFAVNHSKPAIEMHTRNHPDSEHYHSCVKKLTPRAIVGDYQLGWLHASPDCTFFSLARGAKPMRDTFIRTLPWEAVRWMAQTRPRIVSMENVREIMKWGPCIVKRGPRGRPILDRQGRVQYIPDPKRQGQTYRRFIAKMQELGYVVETRILNAADYGAPTARKRWFLIARCDGEPIRWPEPTHGPGRAKPYRTAAECIDFSLPCPSIFMTRAEAKAWRKQTGQTVRRPLRPKTMARIAEGVRRFVLEHPKPFIVHINHSDGTFRGQDLDRPVPTITGEHGFALVAPTLVQTGYGERAGQTPRVPGLDKPLGTVVACGAKHAVVASTLVRMNHGDKQAHDIEKPLPVVMAGGMHHALVSAFLAKHNTKATGQEPTAPLDTLTTTNTKAVVAVHLSKAHGHGWDREAGTAVDKPIGTVVGKADDVLVAAHITKLNENGVGQDARDPIGTVVAGAQRFGMVAAFLEKYYRGANGQDAREPLHTATTHARFGLVTVQIDGETYAIVDIGMRMLTPRELARCMGFPDSYVLTGTNRDQVARIGNAVPPDVAAAIVSANLDPARVKPKRTRRAA